MCRMSVRITACRSIPSRPSAWRSCAARPRCAMAARPSVAWSMPSASACHCACLKTALRAMWWVAFGSGADSRDLAAQINARSGAYARACRWLQSPFGRLRHRHGRDAQLLAARQGRRAGWRMDRRPTTAWGSAWCDMNRATAFPGGVPTSTWQQTKLSLRSSFDLATGPWRKLTRRWRLGGLRAQRAR